MDNGQKKQPRPEELTELVKKANQGDSQAIGRLISDFDAKTGVGEYKRTPEEIAASNKKIWNNLATGAKNFFGEVLPIYDTLRLITGKDPVTGEKTSRLAAAGWLEAELIPGNDLLKGGKLLSKADDVADVAKAIDKVDDVGDVVKTNQGVGNSVPILGRVSTGRTVANTLEEQLAMKEVMSNPLSNAFEIPVTMTDPR